MHKQIKKIEKENKKEGKMLKALEKKDIKMDKKYETAMHKAKELKKKKK